jgi:uncharacterized protein (TIGR02145 family)
MQGVTASQVNCLANTSEDTNFVDTYGCLYTFADAQKVCPAGWHLPTQADFNALLAYVGSNDLMKSQNLRATSWGGLDSYGFAALPAGIYLTVSNGNEINAYQFFGISTRFWASTTLEANNNIYGDLLIITDSSAGRGDYRLNDRNSVRCLKD